MAEGLSSCFLDFFFVWLEDWLACSAGKYVAGAPSEIIRIIFFLLLVIYSYAVK